MVSTRSRKADVVLVIGSRPQSSPKPPTTRKSNKRKVESPVHIEEPEEFKEGDEPPSPPVRTHKRLKRLNEHLESECDSDEAEYVHVSESEPDEEEYESELDDDEKAEVEGMMEELIMEALGSKLGLKMKSGADAEHSESEWMIKIRDSKIPDVWKDELLRRASELDKTHEYDRQDGKTELLLRRVLKIPFGEFSPVPVVETRADKGQLLIKAERELDKAVYGMHYAKTEILNVVAQMLSGMDSSSNLSKVPKPRVFCLVSPPGLGKTHLATIGLKAVLNRPAITFNMAGMTDATQFLGCSFFYEGAHPGALYDALVTAKCMDPILVFDEVDKIAETAHGKALTNTLIHLTDPMANDSIKDAYLAPMTLDFSHTTMVFLCNEPENIPPVLRNRMHFIHVDPPSFRDRVHIVREYLWKQVLEQLQLSHVLNKVKLNEPVIEMLLRMVEKDDSTSGNGNTGEGLRGVKHMLTTLALNLNRQYLSGQTELDSLSPDHVQKVIEQSGHGHKNTSNMNSSVRMMYL